MISLPVHEPLLFQVRKHLDLVLVAERFAPAERKFKSGAAHVSHEDQQLIRGDAGVLGRGSGEELGIAHDVLVERIARGDKYTD
jgi:hypothetical protein